MKPEIFAAAERYLAARAHSIGELTAKLRKKFPDQPEEIEACVCRMQDAGLINDAAFAKGYAEYMIRHHPKGIFLLKMEMSKKGLSATLIAETLAELEINEAQMARTLAEQKLNTFPVLMEQRQKMEKLYRFLLSRGFPFDLAQSIAREIVKNPDS